MPQEFLTVVAHIQARPGKEQLVRAELLKLISPTRAEKGCIKYDLHQSTSEPEKFLFHEHWTDEAALRAHLGTAHIAALQAKAEELLAEPVDVGLWVKIS